MGSKITNLCYLPNDEPLDATDCAICFHLSKYSAIATTEGIRAIPIPVPGVALENILTWWAYNGVIIVRVILFQLAY